MKFSIGLEDIEEEGSSEDLLVSNSEVELVEPYVEHNQQTKAVERAFEAIRMLEDTLCIVRENHEGMTAGSLRMLNHSTSVAASLVGQPQPIKVTSSMENISSISARMRNTKVALESIKKFILDIWQAIKNAIKQVIAWLLRFFHQSTASYKKTLDKIKYLRKSLASNPGLTKETPRTKFNNAVAINKLKTTEQGEILRGVVNLKIYTDVVTKTLNEYTHKTMLATLDDAEKTLLQKKEPKTDIRNHMTLPSFFVEQFIDGYATPDFMQSYRGDLILPGSVFPAVFQISATALTNLKYKRSLVLLANSKFFFASSVKNIATPQEVDFLDKNNLDLYLQTLEAICMDSIKNEDNVTKIVDAKKRLDQLISHFLNKESKNEEQQTTVPLGGNIDLPQNEDDYGFKLSDTPMFRFSFMIRSMNSYMDNLPIKMLIEHSKLVQDTLYYGLAYAADNINDLKAS